jgi:hypothetical protein
VRPDIVDCQNVWVIKRRSRSRFTLEPSQSIGIGGKRRRQYLDRDVALQARVARTIHLAHAAGADLTDDLVRAKAGAG